jgi:hypothetical protein
MEFDDSTHITNPGVQQSIVLIQETVLKPVYTRVSFPPITSQQFDESADAWMANKVRKGAMFHYRCPQRTEAGAPCKNAPSKREGANGLCLTHLKQQEAAHTLLSLRSAVVMRPHLPTRPPSGSHSD